MNVAGLRALVGETRRLHAAVNEAGHDETASSIVVSGMLAEQLARELGRGAAAGAVRVRGDSLSPGDLAVHVFAGAPSDDDTAYVRSANSLEVPVVLVQLWPQEDWTAPLVLSPFVVECRPGEGFPIAEIAARVVDAVGSASSLGDRVPVLRDALERRAVREAVARAAFVAAVGARGAPARPLVALEQARLLARLHPVGEEQVPGGPQAAAAGAIALLQGWGLLFRGLARRTRRVVPGPVTDAAVAAGGTWLLAAAAKAARARLAAPDA
jgi:hypothetical protein